MLVAMLFTADKFALAGSHSSNLVKIGQKVNEKRDTDVGIDNTILILGFVTKPDTSCSPAPPFQMHLLVVRRFLVDKIQEECKPSLNRFVVQIYFLLHFGFRRET